MKFKKFFLAAMLTTTTLSYSYASNPSVKEKVFNLGVLNGQHQGGGVVKISRTLVDPVFYRLDLRAEKKEYIVIKDAIAKNISNGGVSVTVGNELPTLMQKAYITLNVKMYIDSKIAPVKFNNRGNDIVIDIPFGYESLELRSDSPVELQIPSNYKGKVNVTMNIESE